MSESSIINFLSPHIASKKYFASANTPSGFKNYFPHIFSNADMLYIIKGGPGTGKSRLIGEVANEAYNRNFEVELFLCSSDPHSLDGLIMKNPRNNKSIGFIDGTSPHTFDPIYPGASDFIVNLGDFWKSDILSDQSEKIKELSKRKAVLFENTYAFLQAAAKTEFAAKQYIYPALYFQKINSAVERLFKFTHNSAAKSNCKLINDDLTNIQQSALYESYETKNNNFCLRMISSVGMDGFVSLDTFEETASQVYYIRDRYGAGNIFLSKVASAAQKYGQSITLSPSPLDQTQLNALFLPDFESGATAFILCDPYLFPFPDENKLNNKNAKIINMDRFYNNEIIRQNRIKIRFAKQCRNLLLDGVKCNFDEIKKVHFELESIYSEAMNFRLKEEFTKKLLINVFRNIEK